MFQIKIQSRRKTMSNTPQPIQVLFLWNLIFTGGEGFKQDLKPELKPASKRKELIQWGLIQEEKRKNKKGSQALYIQVTEKGWKWANDNITADFSKRSTASGPALAALLSRLNNYLNQHQLSLAEILGLLNNNLAENEPEMDLEQRIKDAYFKVSGGKWNVRVHLHELRQNLPDISRQSLDQKLLDMQKHEKLVLYNMDDVRHIRPEDEAAAIDIAGFKRHIIYMEG